MSDQILAAQRIIVKYIESYNCQTVELAMEVTDENCQHNMEMINFYSGQVNAYRQTLDILGYKEAAEAARARIARKIRQGKPVSPAVMRRVALDEIIGASEVTA